MSNKKLVFSIFIGCFVALFSAAIKKHPLKVAMVNVPK